MYEKTAKILNDVKKKKKENNDTKAPGCQCSRNSNAKSATKIKWSLQRVDRKEGIDLWLTDIPGISVTKASPYYLLWL